MKLLIVDDEHSVHEQIQSIIPWEELGWEIAGHAFNGMEAKEMVERSRPQIIITDIKMPLMDGLSFMEWLSHSTYQAKVIVLSGYGDLEYTRPAFLYQAFDYLLKPIVEAELLTVLERAVDQFNQDSVASFKKIKEKAVLKQGLVLMQDEFFTEIVSLPINDENEIYVRAEQLMLELPRSSYVTVTVKLFDLEDRLNERYGGDRSVFYFAIRNVIEECLRQGLVFRNLRKTNEFVMIYPDHLSEIDSVRQFIQKLHHCFVTYLKISAKYGVSSSKRKISELSSAYRESAITVESLILKETKYISFYGEDGKKALSSDPPKDQLWKEINELVGLVLEFGDVHNGQILLKKINDAFKEERLSNINGMELKTQLSEFFSRVESSSNDPNIFILLRKAKSYLDELQINAVKKVVMDLVTYLIEQITLDQRTKTGKELVDLIKQYIEENYRSVSLKDVANHFYLNKNYICTLFKNESGENFMDYVTSVRINKAKSMLTNSDLKVYEISGYVGYNDQRYFSQVFRKFTGMQPMKYRELYQQRKAR